jgi:uncharacterized protein (DUF2384 family)
MSNLALTLTDGPIFSPEKVMNLLRVQATELAAAAKVHRNTIRVSPSTAKLQNYMRDLVRVLTAASDLFGDTEKAVSWVRNAPLQTFSYRTPMQLIEQERTDDLVRYIESLQGGFSG